MPDDVDPDHTEVPIQWTGADELAVLFVNHFIAQVENGEIFLTAGQLVPPAFVGTAEQQREQAENLDFVPVKTAARLSMTPSRLRELISVLQITLQNHELQQGSSGDPRDI